MRSNTCADIEPILKEIVEVLVREYQPTTIAFDRIDGSAYFATGAQPSYQ